MYAFQAAHDPSAFSTLTRSQHHGAPSCKEDIFVSLLGRITTPVRYQEEELSGRGKLRNDSSMPVTFCWHVPLPTLILYGIILSMFFKHLSKLCLQLLLPFSLKVLNDFTFSLPPACIHFQIIIIWLRFCCGFLYSLRNICWRLTACICEGDLIQKWCLCQHSQVNMGSSWTALNLVTLFFIRLWRDRETKTYRYGPTYLLTMKDGFTRQSASKRPRKYQNVRRQRRLFL